MSILERLGLEKLGFARRRPIALVVAQTDVAVAAGVEEAPAPQRVLAQPELMDEQSHPLRFYPGFQKFVERWNDHAQSDERLEAQKKLFEARTRLDGASSVEELRGRLNEAAIQKTAAESRFDQVGSGPKTLERDARAKARNVFRRSREELKRAEIGSATPIAVEKKCAEELDQVDDKFGLLGDKEHFVFYVATRIGSNQERIDQLVRQFKHLSFRESSSWLLRIDTSDVRSVNCSILIMLDRISGKQREFDAVWAEAGKMANRQIAIQEPDYWSGVFRRETRHRI